MKPVMLNHTIKLPTPVNTFDPPVKLVVSAPLLSDNTLEALVALALDDALDPEAYFKAQWQQG
jgi:hypothetical protein